MTAEVERISIERCAGEGAEGEGMASSKKIVAPVRANDPSVTEIKLSFQELEDEHAVLVASALPGNTHVIELDLSFNDALTDAIAQAVLKALPDCSQHGLRREDRGTSARK